MKCRYEVKKRADKRWIIVDLNYGGGSIADFKLKRFALDECRRLNEHESNRTKDSDTDTALAVTVVVCGNEMNDRIGIHLLSPDQSEVEDAINRADRDGFSHVYVHSLNVRSLDFKREQKSNMEEKSEQDCS